MSKEELRQAIELIEKVKQTLETTESTCCFSSMDVDYDDLEYCQKELEFLKINLGKIKTR